MIDRAVFVARWEDRAAKVDDPFDQFFCLWIALVIQARPLLDLHQLGADDTDRAAVVRLCQARADAIFTSLGDVSGEMRWLAARKGTHRGDPIVDVYDYARHRDHLRIRFRRLAEHYAGTRQYKAGLIVEAVAELINHVRNNLFHGVKDPEQVDDQEPVQHLVPVIRAVLCGAGGREEHIA